MIKRFVLGFISFFFPALIFYIILFFLSPEHWDSWIGGLLGGSVVVGIANAIFLRYL